MARAGPGTFPRLREAFRAAARAFIAAARVFKAAARVFRAAARVLIIRRRDSPREPHSGTGPFPALGRALPHFARPTSTLREGMSAEVFAMEPAGMVSASAEIAHSIVRDGMVSASAEIVRQIGPAGMASASAEIAHQVFEIEILTARVASWDVATGTGIATGTSVVTTTGGDTVAAGSTTRG